MPDSATAGAESSLSVMVLIDWQNTYNGAREAFNLRAEGPIAGNVDPWSLRDCWALLGILQAPIVPCFKAAYIAERRVPRAIQRRTAPSVPRPPHGSATGTGAWCCEPARCDIHRSTS
jgi:hypothetical protein